MATRQSSKQVKSKTEAKVDRSATNEPSATSEPEPKRRNPRVRFPATARTSRAGLTAAATPKPRLNGSETVYDKPQQARSRSKATARSVPIWRPRMRAVASDLQPVQSGRS
jgi:hypothetical protein